MIIENAEELRDWLTRYLEPLCDADPIALAKYVMALIKKDKPERDLKTVCLDQLEVFLQDKTITFVDTLFETIANKSYMKPPNTVSATTTPLTPTSTPKPITSDPIPIVQTDTSSSPAVKTPEVGTMSTNNSIKISEPHISSNLQTTAKTDSTHESSHRLRDNKRNRSRSRSRSPLRSVRRNEFDSRRLGPVPNRNNGSAYFNEDRRNRRGLPNRRAGGQRFGGYRNDRNDRDYRRQRDLKRGRSRSRSRSYSSGSSRSRSPRSRSRSWSRERGDRDSPNNKKSRPSSRPTSRSPSPTKAVPKDGSKKCRDYEEKGFCLKGHLCPYDHGNDPVVLDSNVSAALGFTNNVPANPPLMPIPNSGIAPNAPNSYMAEPYNPEAPGMDPQRPHPPQGPPPMGPRMPPPFWGPMGHIRGPMPPGPPLHPPQFMPPPGRPRELIGVPTIDNNHRQTHSNRTVIEPMSMGHRGGMRGGHVKHMGRGGYRNVRRINNDSADKTCLEVRKIPSNMNTISHLNQHFSKFGTIVNLQVCHEGDPEAALVQYSSHSEALAAIRNTEAVLNNRFIKVFWHSKELQQKHEQVFGVKTEITDESDSGAIGAKISIKDRLGPKVTEGTESVLTAVNSSGTISRTVFDRSKLKKNNTNNNQKDISNSTEANYSQMPSDKNSTSPDVKTKNPMTDKTNKKQIYSKQHKLLDEMINKQKQLMTKLMKSTNENEKKRIKDTIDMISNQIKLINDDMKKQMSLKKAVKKPKTKEQVATEILDIDLEMFIKMQNNDKTYLELAKEYAKLKRKEKTFGVRGRGARAFPRRGRGLTRRGSFYGRGSNPLLKVDRRTRKLLIPDINEDDITDLLEHLAQFSDIEVIEPSSNGAVVTFKTRMEAEKAIQNIGQIKFKENCQLSYSWFDDTIAKSADKSLIKSISSEPKALNEANEIQTLGEEELLDYEEDDTEDESEARNWKA